MRDVAIDVRGRSIKIVGMPIIRVPKDKTFIMNGCHIENGKIIKRGEMGFIPREENILFIITNNIIKL